jgi:hypothetical protein
MTWRLIMLTLVLATTTADAEPLPQPKPPGPGGSCPQGYPARARRTRCRSRRTGPVRGAGRRADRSACARATVGAEGHRAMITFLLVVLWFFVVLPYLFRRMFPLVVIEPSAPSAPAVTVLTPSIVIHVHLPKG